MDAVIQPRVTETQEEEEEVLIQSEVVVVAWDGDKDKDKAVKGFKVKKASIGAPSSASQAI